MGAADHSWHSERGTKASITKLNRTDYFQQNRAFFVFYNRIDYIFVDDWKIFCTLYITVRLLNCDKPNVICKLDQV